MRNTNFAYCVSFILLCLNLCCSILFANPEISVEPKEIVAGAYQTMIFTFQPDTLEILPGGGVRIELPVAYLETGPYYWDEAQNILPDYRGFVSSRGSRGTKTKTSVYGNKNGVIECQAEMKLKPGEQLLIQYSGIVQSLVWPLPVRSQWRQSAEDSWHNFTCTPDIKITSLNAVVLLLVTPADLQQSETFDLAIVILDKYGNKATGYQGIISLTSTDRKAQIPEKYTFTKKDSGIHIFHNVQYRTEGFQRITATDGNLTGSSNYSFVTLEAPRYKRYFGDTHFHTGTGTNHKSFTERGAGGDHRGHFTSAIFAYKYARDIMRLDFASSTEHDSKLFDDDLWVKSQDISDAFYVPGKFTTFYAYEWTATAKVGHNVIVYKDKIGKVLNHFDYPTKRDLWAAFDRQNIPVIMIPHPMWTQPDHEMWSEINNTYRTIGEIYSLWCTRFLLHPAVHSQRFELGIENPWSFQYAWAKGHKIGVIGSSDNHTAHPGMNNYTTDMVHSAGLAVVLAEENNRENIWDAFKQRRTYATTGTRILLDFRSNGHVMGSEYSTDQDPQLSGSVAGTNTIERVEIVKFDGKSFTVIYSANPESDIAKFNIIDNDFVSDCMYYLRVKQVNEIWKSPWAYGTAEMAWSSPIWVNKAQ